jgi:site-specific DNA recombinase
MYVRVSTGTQVHGTSIDSQREQCATAAQLHGCTVVGEYVDAGVSGARAARPALDELMAAVLAGQVDLVIVAKLDRLGRSLLHLLTLIGQLDTLGVRVISAGDHVDTRTPAGRMMLQLLGVFAEFERERIRERSTDGAHRRVAEGGFVSSSPPFGYRAVPDPVAGRGVVLDLDPTQAACIRAMFQLLVRERIPVTQAAAALNQAGHRSASGAKWTQQTLSRWARGHGPVTASGAWAWNGITVAIPPILTTHELTEWNAWKRDTALAHNGRGSYLLGGRAHTPCDGRYHGRTAGTQTPVYACKHRLTTKPGDPNRCGCRPIPVTALDDAVWTEVRAALTDRARLAELSTPAAGPARPDIGAETLGETIADTASMITQLQQAIAAEYQAARDDGYDPATARLMVQSLHADLKHAHGNLARLSNIRAALSTATGDTTSRDAVALLWQARARPDGLDTHGKQLVLDALGVTVHITGYTTCPSCGGTGYQPIPPGYGRHWPPGCSTCHRFRTVPELTVTITAPQALLAALTGHHDRAATAG